jgi:hypothetical protein
VIHLVRPKFGTRAMRTLLFQISSNDHANANPSFLTQDAVARDFAKARSVVMNRVSTGSVSLTSLIGWPPGLHYDGASRVCSGGALPTPAAAIHYFKLSQRAWKEVTLFASDDRGGSSPHT